MKRFRFEIQNINTFQIETLFIEAENLLEAAKLANKENYRCVCIWQVPLL